MIVRELISRFHLFVFDVTCSFPNQVASIRQTALNWKVESIMQVEVEGRGHGFVSKFSTSLLESKIKKLEINLFYKVIESILSE